MCVKPLPAGHARSRGSSVLQRRGSPFPNPRKRMAYFLPFRPYQRAVGFSDPKTASLCFHKLIAPLRHFDATSASPQTGRPTSKILGRHQSRQSSTSLEFQRPYSMSGLEHPFCHFPSGKRPRIVAVILESPALRVWLPSRRCRPLEPLGMSFNPQRS